VHPRYKCRALNPRPTINPNTFRDCLISFSMSSNLRLSVRTVLYEAASAMLVRSKQWCGVKAWGVRIAAKRGHKRAVVAVARKLAVVMHRMWIDGSAFRFAAEDEHAAQPNLSNPTALAAAM